MVGRCGYLEAAGIAAAPAGAHFAGQQPHQPQLGPLARPKWLQQLLPGVLESRSNGIYGGNRQNAPRFDGRLRASYCEAGNTSSWTKFVGQNSVGQNSQIRNFPHSYRSASTGSSF